MGQGEATSQYQIVIAPRVARNLGRLGRRVMERVARRIDALVQQPYLGKPLKGRLKDKHCVLVISEWSIASIQQDIKSLLRMSGIVEKFIKKP